MGSGRDRAMTVVLLVVWLPLLVYLALLPRTPRVPFIPASLASPLAHVATSAVLAALFYWILSARAFRRRDRILSAVVSAGLASVVGIAFELVQSRYSDVRSFESTDIISGVLGAVLAVFVVVTLADMGVSRLEY